MYRTHLFRDADAKAGAVNANRRDMVTDYIVKGIGPTAHHDTIEDLVNTFFADNPRADWVLISDFCSTSVADWKENEDDLLDT